MKLAETILWAGASTQQTHVSKIRTSLFRSCATSIVLRAINVNPKFISLSPVEALSRLVVDNDYEVRLEVSLGVFVAYNYKALSTLKSYLKDRTRLAFKMDENVLMAIVLTRLGLGSVNEQGTEP